MSHGQLDNNAFYLPEAAWTRVRNALVFVALVGWTAAGTGFALYREQFHFSYLVAFLYFVSVLLGAMFFVMVQHLSGSVWSITVRRLMETAMRVVPLAALLFIPVAAGVPLLYEWASPHAAHDPILVKKLGYLNPQWFTIRGFLVIALWSALALALYRTSRAQDESGAVALTKRAVKISAPGVVLLFVTASMAAFDWIMSLDPHWWSTMFGVYFLAGGAVGFMAVLLAVCLGLRSAGYLADVINTEHYHDLGKWLFAVTVFWAYVSFSQYMLIWYGNLPEEDLWFKYRLAGSWYWFRPILVAGHFVIPFFAMIARASKRNLKMLGAFAGWMLVMHYLDLHWQVMPVLHKKGFEFHWLDVATLIAVGSTCAVAFWAGLRERPLVPVGDPRLKQCLAFHNS